MTEAARSDLGVSEGKQIYRLLQRTVDAEITKCLLPVSPRTIDKKIRHLLSSSQEGRCLVFALGERGHVPNKLKKKIKYRNKYTERIIMLMCLSNSLSIALKTISVFNVKSGNSMSCFPLTTVLKFWKQYTRL